jgi:hypothetical protein
MAQPLHIWKAPGAGNAVAIYVHGYYDTVESALRKHRLVDQFKKSGRAATFLVPEAPGGSSDYVRWPDLQALLEAAGVPNADPVVAVGHSGAHRTLRKWLKHPRLRHLILLDALYGGYDQFLNWGKQPGHTMQVVGHDTARASYQLAEAVGAPYHQAPRGHMAIVEDGKWIPELLARSPLPGAFPWGLALGGAAIFVAWRLLR